MAVIESKGDGFAVYNGAKVPISEVPEGAEYISLDGMRVIEWDGDTTGLTVGSSGETWYVVVENANIDVNKGFVRMLSTNKVYTGDWSSTEQFYSALTVRFYPSGEVEFRKTTAYNSLLAYYPIEEEPEEPTTVHLDISYQTAHGSTPNAKTVTVNVGESYVLTNDDLPALSADGYLFVGWSVNGEIISAGYSVSADTVLTAVWVEDMPISEIDPTSMMLGWLVGQALRSMRK